tara:strand:- start:31 stop:222 length:192 start_codon:yes stop_codon:yes gene_type:complete
MGNDLEMLEWAAANNVRRMKIAKDEIEVEFKEEPITFMDLPAAPEQKTTLSQEFDDNILYHSS